MRLLLSTLALTFLSATSLFADGTLDKKLQNLFNSGEKSFDVIVKFKKQNSVDDIVKNSKRNRRSHEETIDDVKNSLERDTEASQKGVKGLCERLQKEGEAQKLESYWLTNTVSLKIGRKALRELQSHPDVDSIVLDENRLMVEPASVASVDSKSKGRGKLQELFPLGNPKADKNSSSGTVGIQAVGGPVPLFADFNKYGQQIIEADRVRREVKDVAGKFIDGTGVTVAVLDTGCQPSALFTSGQIIAGKSFITTEPDPLLDGNGHGTHCAGTVGSKDFGVAPGCKILAVKVLANSGSGSFSFIQGGVQFAVAQKVKVISMSLGSDRDTAGADIVELAVRNAVAANITCVIANGNAGPNPSTVGSPGSEPSCIAVGAMDQTGATATFSSRGPNFEQVARPDVSAPGVSIVSAAPNGGTATLSGTSMATPHVAGVVALLLQAKSDLTPALIKKALQDTCVGRLVVNETGSGLVNAFKAVTLFRPAVPPAPNQPGPEFFLQQKVIDDLLVELRNIFGSTIGNFRFTLVEFSVSQAQRTSLVRLRIQNVPKNTVVTQRVDLFLSAVSTTFRWLVTDATRTALTTISKS